MRATTTDYEVAQFFRENYIRWAVGQLEPSLEAELDDLSPPGWENWKATMEREYGYDADEFRKRHTSLCTTFGLTDTEALKAMLRSESSLPDPAGKSHPRAS